MLRKSWNVKSLHLIVLIVSLAMTNLGFAPSVTSYSKLYDERVGGLDEDQYCRGIGATNHVKDPSMGAWGMGCEFDSGGRRIWLTQEQLDEACRLQYNPDAYARHDSDDPDSWHCEGPSQVTNGRQYAGGIDFDAYCRTLGATHNIKEDPRGPWGVGCRFGSGGSIQWLGQADMDAACQSQIGADTYGAINGNKPENWYCARGGTREVVPDNDPNHPKGNNNSGNSDGSGNSNSPNKQPNNPPDLCSGWNGRMIVGQIGRVTFTDGTPTRLRSTPSKSAHTIYKMPEGYTFTVIGGPTCSEGFIWWQLHTTEGDGWAVEGDSSSRYIEPWSSNSSGPSQNNSGQQADPCDETYLPLKVHARNSNDFTQCVNYVRNHRPDTKDIHGNGGEWAKIAKSQGFDVVTGDLTQWKTGDIVVWSGSCAVVPEGHVAILIYAVRNGDKITLHYNDANHCPGGVCDGRIYYDQTTTVHINKPCMSLIHPKPGVQADLDGQTPPAQSGSNQSASGQSGSSQSGSSNSNQSTDKCSQYSGLRWLWCKLSGG